MKALLSLRAALLALVLAPSLPAQTLFDYYAPTAQMNDSYNQTASGSLVSASRIFTIEPAAWPMGLVPSSENPSSATFTLLGGGTLAVPIVDSPSPTVITVPNYVAVTQVLPPYGFYAALTYIADASATAPTTLSSVLHGGTLDGVSYTATGNPAFLPVPFLFSAATFDRFTSGNLAGAISIDFTPVAIPGGVTNALASVTIVTTPPENSQEVFFTTLNPGDSSTMFDTSVLQPDQSYSMYVGEQFTASDGNLYITNTTVTFTTIPEPAAMAACLGSAALALVAWRQSRRRDRRVFAV